MSPKTRRRVTDRPKGIFLSHVQTDQSTCFPCFGWDTGPEFNQLTKDHRLFLQRKEEEGLIMWPILPWSVPMRGSCAQAHAVARTQMGPNTFRHQCPTSLAACLQSALILILQVFQSFVQCINRVFEVFFPQLLPSLIDFFPKCCRCELGRRSPLPCLWLPSSPTRL